MQVKTEMRSEDMKEIVTKVPGSLLRYGNILILGLLIMFICLAWLIKYPEVIRTPAIITTTIPVQKEYAKMGAKIQAIFVNDNADVSENQVLAILENSANYLDVFQLKSMIDSFDIENPGTYIPNTKKYALGDVENAYNIFETNFRQYRLYQNLRPFDTHKLANNNTLNELRFQLKELRIQRNTNNEEFKLKQIRLGRSQSLFNLGVISASEHEQAKLEFSTHEIALNSLNMHESRLIASIHNAERLSKINVIDKTREESNLYNNTKISLQELRKTITEWELNYILKANIDGTVNFHDFWAEHQSVNKGNLVFSIIPKKHSEFIGRLEAPAYNSSKIKIGQNVNLSIMEYPEIEFGYLIGKVKSISLVPNNDGNYLIKVELPNNLITTYNTEIRFSQEMQAQAEIITEDRRLIETIFYQFKSFFSRK